METILERIESRLERLEAQNEILRKELHGIRSSSSTKNSFALMEAKTLREVVEEIQFDVKSLNSKLANIESRQEGEAEMISRFVDNEEKRGLAREEEFQVVEIRSKTLQEEKNWLKPKFQDIRAKSAIEEGASFRRRTLRTISNSIPLANEETSCVLKLSNHLNVPLTDPQFLHSCGTKTAGPSVVAGHFSDVFVGSGTPCHFLCSFSIINSLRMVIYCVNSYNGKLFFIIGFVPQNVATDLDLSRKLNSMPLSPDICKNIPFDGKGPLELFVTTGQFLVGGRMRSDGPRGFVEVDILEMADPRNKSLRILKEKKISSNLKRTVEKISKGLKINQEIPGKMSCSVEVVNLLNVTLKSVKLFYTSSKWHNFIPSQVKPSEGATFFASDDTNVDGMFSFEIQSTDLCLVIGFKAQGKNSRFSAAFLPQPAPRASKQEIEKLMDEKHWKSHNWRKSAQAEEGEQVLEIRNIRVMFSMTEEEKSLLKIQVFAF